MIGSHVLSNLFFTANTGFYFKTTFFYENSQFKTALYFPLFVRFSSVKQHFFLTCANNLKKHKFFFCKDLKKDLKKEAIKNL